MVTYMRVIVNRDVSLPQDGSNVMGPELASAPEALTCEPYPWRVLFELGGWSVLAPSSGNIFAVLWKGE